MSNSGSPIRSSPRVLVSSAVVVALAVLALVLAPNPAVAAGFHRCGPVQKLENNGIFNLKAKKAKCKRARQVAYARFRGDETPKGFTCRTGVGGNLTPFTCVRTASVIKFFLEG